MEWLLSLGAWLLVGLIRKLIISFKGGVEKFIIMWYNNAIFLKYSRKGNATRDFWNKLEKSCNDAF